MNLKEMGFTTRNWTDSTQDRNYWRALANASSISRDAVRLEEFRIAFNISTDKTTLNRFSGRSRFRWEDNIKISFKEISVKMRTFV